MEGGMENWRCSTNISLYFVNNTRCNHSYNGRRIGTVRDLSNDFVWPKAVN